MMKRKRIVEIYQENLNMMKKNHKKVNSLKRNKEDE